MDLGRFLVAVVLGEQVAAELGLCDSWFAQVGGDFFADFVAAVVDLDCVVFFSCFFFPPLSQSTINNPKPSCVLR